MREIEFKAKSSENGEWVYGDLAHSYSVKNGVKVDCFLVGLNYDFYEVISETVCQFTGLKDKLGNEVYEGDILFLPESEYSKIVYKDDSFCCERKKDGDNVYNWLYEKLQVGAYVVGNIFENPKLVEERK